MTVIKNAFLRYQTLDRCFKNTGRKYLIDNLLEEVNTALFDDNPSNSGIQIRQLRDDIKFMKSEAGFNAPIESRVIDGKKHAYFYIDPNFSISNMPINETELLQFKNALTLLSRFEGSPGFEWISEVSVILQDSFGLKTNNEKVISFERNLDYTGENFITQLFNAIVNKRVLSIEYEPFGQERSTIQFHPYFLKQYNNRWFVFGLNEENNIATWNLALDRIKSLEEIHVTYRQNETDWDFHFSSIYGVSKPFDKNEEEIHLLFSKRQAPYIITKPIHETQKHYELEDGLLVKIKVIPNFDLEQLILSFGERVKVLLPIHLKEKISARIELSLSQYKEN
jgi:predicted DNA-binding transcriptional regulator YafY